MNDLTGIAKFVAGDFRYGLTVLSVFVLGLLLLFVPELPPFARQFVLPGLVVYTIGSALISHVQILLTVSANTKAQAENQTPRGISEGYLTAIIVAHVLWFLLFLGFLIWRACVSE